MFFIIHPVVTMVTASSGISRILHFLLAVGVSVGFIFYESCCYTNLIINNGSNKT